MPAPESPAGAVTQADQGARHDLVLRLHRVEGQVRAVAAMVESCRDCEAIAQQLAAARKALDRAFFELMACAIEHPQFSATANEAQHERVRRVARTLARFA